MTTETATLARTTIPVLSSTLERIANAICLERDKFYIKEADIVVSSESKYPILRAGLNIEKPGHYKSIPGLTHAPDSLAAVGQMGYVFFAQTSLSGLMTDVIPALSIDQIISIFRNENEKWAVLKGGEFDYKQLPPICVGVMKIKKVSPAPTGFFFDTQISLAKSDSTSPKDIQGPSNHIYSSRYSANF